MARGAEGAAMKNIQRWQPDEGVLLHATITGWFVSYADHEAAVAALMQERDALQLRVDGLHSALDRCEHDKKEIIKIGNEKIAELQARVDALEKP